jgi:dTDP-glucose pyrophosphorylase
MSDWYTCRVAPGASVKEAMQRIQESELRIAVVTTDDDRLLGVVTDGDIRRAMLEGMGQEVPVTQIMTEDPVTARKHTDRASIVRLMRKHHVHQIPVVDRQGRVVRLESIDDVIGPEERSNLVVVMAGGLGTRLRPITEDCPKPMVEVGGVPILETILERLSAQGFQNVYLSVNYKADMIEEHFGDGRDWGVQVNYLREQKRRGTAGALSLLPERPSDPLLVLNGDLLTTLNFGRLIDFHRKQSVTATMCVRGREVEIPYGVVETDGHEVSGIEEKPTYRHFVNAGIYVLEPDTLDAVPDDQFYDMTEHLQHLIDTGESVTAYPIREYWRDIGQKKDLFEAKEEFENVFL